MEDEWMRDVELRLVLQTALLGAVGPRLRAVSYERRGEDVEIGFWFDGPVSDEDRESASVAVTEVIAALPADVRVSEQVVRWDAPARIPPGIRRVYQRREPD